MDDVQQMIVNELQRLDRAIQKRTKTIEQLESKAQAGTVPKRYVLEYELPVALTNFGTGLADPKVLGVPLVRSFVVDRDCKRFCCQEIVCAVAAVGAIAGISGSNKVSLNPELSRNLNFTWSVRDTATDREWQNHPLFRYFLASGLTAPLALAWPASMRSGAEIEVALTPTEAENAVPTVFESLEYYTVQIAFVGFEVL
jgi:hypothetical protein